MDDGNYYCLDATWDEGRSSYSYFLKGTAAFNKDHLVDTGEKATYFWSQYPVSNTDFAPDAPAIPAAPRVTIGNSSDSGKPKLTWAAVDSMLRVWALSTWRPKPVASLLSLEIPVVHRKL